MKNIKTIFLALSIACSFGLKTTSVSANPKLEEFRKKTENEIIGIRTTIREIRVVIARTETEIYDLEVNLPVIMEALKGMPEREQIDAEYNIHLKMDSRRSLIDELRSNIQKLNESNTEIRNEFKKIQQNPSLLEKTESVKETEYSDSDSEYSGSDSEYSDSEYPDNGYLNDEYFLEEYNIN